MTCCCCLNLSRKNKGQARALLLYPGVRPLLVFPAKSRLPLFLPAMERDAEVIRQRIDDLSTQLTEMQRDMQNMAKLFIAYVEKNMPDVLQEKYRGMTWPADPVSKALTLNAWLKAPAVSRYL